MGNEFDLIKKYELYIYKIAKKFYNVELSDLYQAGCIGLIKANRNFNEDSGANFMNFAYKYIFGEMYELANKSRDIKLNKYYLKIYKLIKEKQNTLIHSLGRNPSLNEICSLLGIDEFLAVEVLQLTAQIVSLENEYQTINGDLLSIKECIGYEDNVDDQILVNDSLSHLEPLEQTVINCRYFEDLTQIETANKLGLSQVKVSRIESKGKQKIKEYIAA